MSNIPFHNRFIRNIKINFNITSIAKEQTPRTPLQKNAALFGRIK